LAVSPTSPILVGVNTIIHAVLIEQLLSRRGNSAGWGHHRGSGQYSAEATALATLAGWQRLDAPARTAILDYWKSHQLPDGGWSSIAPLSCGGNWPTAIIANTLAQIAPKHPSLPKALRSLVSAEPGEAFWLWRLKFRTTDTQVRFDPSKYGWSWGSDSVSWVIPTAGAILALERGRRLGLIRGREVERRLAVGCSMLLDRMCPGGGWNAGNSVVYGVALAPHIDATSIALAGLRFHCHLPEVRQSFSWLLASDCSSAFSLASKILALQSYVDVRSDARPAMETAQAKLAVLTQEPAQIADTSTLAFVILARSGNPNPFALEVAE
jgi:hypothetical protein